MYVRCGRSEQGQELTYSYTGVSRGILHGGMSAMIIDETLGALVYVLKRDGVIGAGPAFTAHLGESFQYV